MVGNYKKVQSSIEMSGRCTEGAMEDGRLRDGSRQGRMGTHN